MKTITERLAESRPAPPWAGVPEGSYAAVTGMGTAFVHPDAEAYTIIDPMGRRVTYRKAPPAPPPPPVDPIAQHFDRDGRPTTLEGLQLQARAYEMAVLRGEVAKPAPKVIVDERPATLEDDHDWQAFKKAVGAWIASDEYEQQNERVRRSVLACEKEEEHRLRSIAASDSPRAARAQRDLDALRERRTRRGDPDRVILEELR